MAAFLKLFFVSIRKGLGPKKIAKVVTFNKVVKGIHLPHKIAYFFGKKMSQYQKARNILIFSCGKLAGFSSCLIKSKTEINS